MQINKSMKKPQLVPMIGLLVSLIAVQALKAETSIINDTNLEQPSKGENSAKEPTVIVSAQSARPAENLVINSIDDGLLSADKSSSERHLYEQQPESVTDTKPSPIAHLDDIDLYHGPIKPEPRLHQDEPQQDPAIIDHRPNPVEQHHQQQNSPQQQQQQQQQQNQVIIQEVYASTTQAPVMQPQQQGNAVQTYILSQPPASNHQPLMQQSVVQQQQAPVSVSAPTNNWYPQQHTVATYAPQTPAQATQQQNGQQQYTMVAQASSQVPTIVQHPTSINSIINEHHHQQQQQQHQQQQQQQQISSAVQTSGQPLTASQGIGQPQLATSTSNQQMVSVNGQPMILMNPNTITNNGRRISISGWLKGISSMLANIFNRREHGAQLMGQSSNPVGQWVQLGSNGPHWLSTAQTVAQNAQYHTQQQQYVGQQHQTPQLLSASGTNRYTTYVQAPTQTQQTVQTTQQSPAMTVSLQPVPTMTSSANQQQQHFHQQQGNDLQASGSSAQYITVSPPTSIQPNQQPQHQQPQPQQNLVNIGQYAPPSASNVHPVTAIVNQQQQQQQQTPTSHPQARQATGASNSQPATQVRFGRSSSLDTTSSSSGLPLAHYSRYALSSD